MPVLSLGWNVYKEKEEEEKKKSHKMSRRTWSAQCERTEWLMGQKVTTPSRIMSPWDFQSDFCMVWLTYLLYWEKKPEHMEINFYKKDI